MSIKKNRATKRIFCVSNFHDANIDGTLTVDGVITSTKTSGAPFIVNSTSKVTNLNADLLDGMTTAAINTVSTVVNRDSNGDFAANQITKP